MRMFLILLVVLIVAVVGVAAFFPMSIVAGWGKQAVPGFAYQSASGTVWKGGLKGVTFDGQAVGDVSLAVDPMTLLKGRVGADVKIERSDVTAEGRLGVGLDGRKPDWRDLKLTGNAAAIPGLPEGLSSGEAKFSLSLAEAAFAGDRCTSASGEAWTNLLAIPRPNTTWTGPELRGPITCQDGRLALDAGGVSSAGEAITAHVVAEPNLRLGLAARVTRVGPAGAEALTALGFRQEGDAYVLGRGGNSLQ